MKLTISYNWEFRINDYKNDEDTQKIFAIKDFIGDMCTFMAAKIRSSVSSVNFENFHKGFARLIRKAIFGVDENGSIKNEHHMTKNNMFITNVDIQCVEPVDEKTKESLKDTVTLAIEITTKNQEEDAKRIAEKISQESYAALQRLQIEYASKAENCRKGLLEYQAESNSIQETGGKNSEAKAKTEADLIRAEASVKLTMLNAECTNMTADSINAREESAFKSKYSLLLKIF